MVENAPKRLHEIIRLVSELEHQLWLSAKDTPWIFAPLTREAYYPRRCTYEICWLDWKELYWRRPGAKSEKYSRYYSDSITPGREFHCAYCGVWYSALWYTETYGSRKEPIISNFLGECVLVDDYQGSLFLPCCSADCAEVLYRIVQLYEKGRDKEWKAINKARKLLKETRAYLKRNHLQDLSNLPKREFEPDLISQTS